MNKQIMTAGIKQYSKGFQLTSIMCQSCGLAWLPNTPIVTETTEQLWIAAKQSHTVVSDIQKTGCINPILKVTFENCLIDNLIIAQSKTEQSGLVL